MQLLFLNESGKLDQGGLFALGGIAVRDDDWAQLRELWQQTLGAHSWPPDKEVKWHGIRTGEVPPALADAIYDALAVAPVACYVAVMDLDRGPEEFSPDEFDYFRSPEGPSVERSSGTSEEGAAEVRCASGNRRARRGGSQAVP